MERFNWLKGKEDKYKDRQVKYNSNFFVLVPILVILGLMILTVSVEPAKAAGKAPEKGKDLITEDYENDDPGYEMDTDSRPSGWEKGKKKGWDDKDRPPGQGRKKGRGKNKDRNEWSQKNRQRRKKLERLKQENPEKFRELMDQRLEKLKERDPEKYARMKEKMQQRQKNQRNWRQMRRKDPEKFQARMKEHLEKLKEEDPEKYEQVMKRLQQAGKRRRSEQGSKDTPPGWGKGRKQGWDDEDTPRGQRNNKGQGERQDRSERVRKHQQIRERLKQFKEKDPELYEYMRGMRQNRQRRSKDNNNFTPPGWE